MLTGQWNLSELEAKKARGGSRLEPFIVKVHAEQVKRDATRHAKGTVLLQYLDGENSVAPLFEELGATIYGMAGVGSPIRSCGVVDSLNHKKRYAGFYHLRASLKAINDYLNHIQELRFM